METLYYLLCAAIYAYFCGCIYVLAKRYDRDEDTWLLCSIFLTPLLTWFMLLAKGNNEKKNWTGSIETMMVTMSATMRSMDANAKAQRDVLCDMLEKQPEEPLMKPEPETVLGHPVEAMTEAARNKLVEDMLAARRR